MLPIDSSGFRHMKMVLKHSITPVQLASRFFRWNTRDTSRWRFAGETRASNVTCIPMQKPRRDLNASDALECFSCKITYVLCNARIQSRNRSRWDNLLGAEVRVGY